MLFRSRGGGGQRPATPPAERPNIDGSSWRRDPGLSDMRAPCEDNQDTRPKKPRRFSQEPHQGDVGHRNQRAAHPFSKKENQENRAAGGGGRGGWESREEDRPSDTGNRHPQGRRAEGGGNTSADFHKKFPEPKRRQGPIKEPNQAEREPGKGASARDSSAHDGGGNGVDEEQSWKKGRGQGRRTPLQDRGQRRPPHPDHRFGSGQIKRDPLPKNKETQTGEIKTCFSVTVNCLSRTVRNKYTLQTFHSLAIYPVLNTFLIPLRPHKIGRAHV